MPDATESGLPERARLVDGAGRCQMLHHLTFIGECGDRHTAADHFTESENIGNPAVIFGGEFTPVPGRRDTETGQHLIKINRALLLCVFRAGRG